MVTFLFFQERQDCTNRLFIFRDGQTGDPRKHLVFYGRIVESLGGTAGLTADGPQPRKELLPEEYLLLRRSGRILRRVNQQEVVDVPGKGALQELHAVSLELAFR